MSHITHQWNFEKSNTDGVIVELYSEPVTNVLINVHVNIRIISSDYLHPIQLFHCLR